MIEYSGWIWMIGMIGFIGWFFWQSGKPIPSGSDKNSPKNKGTFRGQNDRW